MACITRCVPRHVLKRAARPHIAALFKKSDFFNIKVVFDKNAISPLLSSSSTVTPAKAPTISPIMPH